MRWIRELCVERITWVVLSGDDKRACEAQHSAQAILGRHPGFRMVTQSFRDGYFPYTAGRHQGLLRIAQARSPSRHRPHPLPRRPAPRPPTRSELTYNTFRDHLVLEYEVMKRDGDLGQPNTYVALDETTVDRKVEHLISHFGSRRDRSWFSEDAFRGLMRLRGIEAGSPSGHAEAFYCRTAVL